MKQSYKGFEAQEKAFKRAEELFEKEADLCYSNIILRLIRARGRHQKRATAIGGSLFNT